jgi:SH3-like domain-containing protein
MTTAVRTILVSMLRNLLVFLLLALPSLSGMAAQYRSVGDEPTILYDAPSAKAKRVFVLGAGYPVEVIVVVEGWTKIRDAGGSMGWVETKALGTKRNVVVRANVAEVRGAADGGAKVAFKVARGVMLEWVETLPGGWVRVRHADAGQGFMQSSELWGS